MRSHCSGTAGRRQQQLEHLLRLLAVARMGAFDQGDGARQEGAIPSPDASDMTFLR